jgi:ethanolamine phosphate phosphodiesterase
MLVSRHLLRVIRGVWIVLILWSEVGVFILAGSRCFWPGSPAVRVSHFLRLYSARLIFVSVLQGGSNATHVLLVADPQILNGKSYPERSSMLRVVSQIFVDLNLRKAWRVARSTRPHTVIFLGDMLDNGFASMPATQYVPHSSPLPFFLNTVTQFQVSHAI